ncbi:MAG: diguanylate cyclase domain-containing protein [Halanaerobium sp.]
MKYLRKYYFLIFLVLFIIIFFINQQNYSRTEKIIYSNFDSEITLIKNSVINSLENAFDTYSISEIVLNQEMRENSKILLEKYEEDKNPKNWNLTKLKSQMPDYEIYIIDQNLKIINSTLAEDMGLDFSKYRDFSKLLSSRMEKVEFIADKLDLAQNTGLINKYSYQPTPDGKYLLELSINITERFPVLEDFNIFTTSRKMMQQYQQLRSINFYKFGQDSNRVGLLNLSNPAKLETVDPETKAMVKETVVENRIQNTTVNNENYQITEIYLPFLVEGNETDSEWWNSFVIRVSYDNQSMINDIEREKKALIFNLSLIVIIFIVFSLIMSYFINKIEEMAFRDHLTGLPNRKAFEKYFNQENRKNQNQKLAILYLDLDGFKEVNDSYGHDTGDLLLKTAASRLKNTIRSQDKVSRMGGDEFTILLTDIESPKDVKKIIKKIEAKIAEPYKIYGKEIKISCSIGYSIDYRAQMSFQELINKADLAMYEVKNDKN